MDQNNKENYNILYVDDEKSNLSSFKNLFRRKFNIITASSGQEGLEILAAQPIHAIITDQRMPNMSGIDFLIKVKDNWPGLKYILLTAYNDSEVIKDAINKTGIFWYVNKPFDPDQMEQIITNASNAYRAENKIKESEEKFRGVFNSISDVFTRSDMEGNCVMVSPSIYNMLGYKPEEVLGKNLEDFYANPKERGKVIEKLQKSKSVKNFVIDVVRKDGKTITISTNAKMYYNSKGEPLGVEGNIREITEQILAEKKIQESEAKYRNLVNNSLIGVFTTSIDGRFLFVNEAMVSMYNFDSVEQMLAEGSLARWADLNQRELLLSELKKNGSVTNFEAETITNTGRCIHVIFSVKLQGDSISGMVMDITYRKLMEEKLQISETNLVKAQEVAHIGSWSLDLLKNNLLWTDENYKIFDIPKGTPLTYETFLEAVHPEDREYVDRKWRSAIEGEPYDIEHRLLIDNEVKWIREKAELTFDKEGNPIGAIGVSQDITKQKRAESEHDKLFNVSFDLLCIAGFDGYFKELNPAWEKTTEYTLMELYSKPFSEFIHPDDIEKTANEIQQLSKGKVSVDFENRYLTKTGKTIILSWTAIPMPEKNQVYCIARDITKRKADEKRIIEYQVRLKDLAHELTVSQEKIRKQIAADLHDHVGQMLASARMQLARITDMEENPELIVRMKSISQGLLKSIQATRTAIFDLSPPQLNEIGLVAATNDWMKVQIEQKHHIKTVISCDSEDFKLNENTMLLLFRSIKELMINTVKHAKAGQIIIALKTIGNMLEITIEDDGVGFDYNPDLLQLKSDSFGLFSIQERMSDLGGKMEVDSVKDKGTLIKLTVPLSEKSL